MELPHMHGSMHKGEVLPGALTASVFAWLLHRCLMNQWNIAPPPTLPPVCLTISEVWYGLPCGLFAGLLSYAFVRVRKVLDRLPLHYALRGLVMGAAVGLIGLCLPDTLLWGEFQIDILANEREPLAVGPSTGLAFAKFFAILLTVASGYGAGIVYPLIMVGYLLGPMGAAVLDKDNAMATCYAHEGDLFDLSHHSDRPPAVELIGQALGSGFLAGTMRAPVGTALLVAGLGRSTQNPTRATFLAVLLLTNFISCYVNPRSGLGLVYGEERAATSMSRTDDRGQGEGKGEGKASQGEGKASPAEDGATKPVADAA